MECNRSNINIKVRTITCNGKYVKLLWWLLLAAAASVAVVTVAAVIIFFLRITYESIEYVFIKFVRYILKVLQCKHVYNC
jgi:hypothetical protein